jgi:predicted nucleic acid-binding protein
MIRAWVIDASVAAKWVLPETGSEKALRLRADRLVAPNFFDIECGSILWKAVRRGVIDQGEALERRHALRIAPVERMPDESLLDLALATACELGHPIYDCLYVAAAEVTGFSLVTADARLARLEPRAAKIVALDDVR